MDQGQAGPRLRTATWPYAEPQPYLPVLGSSYLRVEEAAPPPPDLATRPASAAPPIPALSPTEATVAAANTTAAGSIVGLGLPPADSPPTTAAEPAPLPKTPAPILPDTTRPIIHAEDFLPYFQIPGSARHPGDVTLFAPGAPSAPAPQPIPPSSATYTQTPR